MGSASIRCLKVFSWSRALHISPEEIQIEAVVDSPRSHNFDQVENRLHVQNVLHYLLLG